MSKLKDLIDGIDYTKLEAKAYNYFSSIYGWESFSEEEYSNNKKAIGDFRAPVLESQDYLLEENKIGKTTFTCCAHYYFISVKDDVLTDLCCCNTRPSLRKNCNCELTEKDVEDFEAVAALKGLEMSTHKHITNVYELDSKDKVVVKSVPTNEVLEDFFVCKKIAELPAHISEKLPEDLVDLIIQEKIKLIGYGSTNNSSFIRYKL